MVTRIHIFMNGHKFLDGTFRFPYLYLHLDNRRSSVVDFDSAPPSLLADDFESPFAESPAVQNSRLFQAAENVFRPKTDSFFKITGTNEMALKKI